MGEAAQLARYAAVRAKFFPPVRPFVRRSPIAAPPAALPSLLAPVPGEMAFIRAGWQRWTERRWEAHRLAVLAIYDEGVQYGRGKIGAIDDATVDPIIIAICRKYGITIPELRGQGRSKLLVSVRREISFELRCNLGMSYPAIGRKLGKDHTSILNLMKRNKRSRSLGMRTV